MMHSMTNRSVLLIVTALGLGLSAQALTWKGLDRIEKEAVEPVASFVSSAYRDEVVSGKVRFFAALNLNPRKHPVAECAAELGYAAAYDTHSENCYMFHTFRTFIKNISYYFLMLINYKLSVNILLCI